MKSTIHLIASEEQTRTSIFIREAVIVRINTVN